MITYPRSGRPKQGLPARLFALAAVVSIASAGCGVAEPIRITHPADGAFLADGTVVIRGEVRAVGADEVRVRDASGPIADNGAFEVEVELTEGTHELDVEAGSARARLTVVVDTTRPALRVDSPELASFIEGDEVRIEGRVDERHLRKLTVDGSDLELDGDGYFDSTLRVRPGAHRMQIVAEDAAGNRTERLVTFMAGEFRAPRGPSDLGVALRVGNDALETIAEGGAAFLDELDWQALLAESNPVYEDWWGEAHLVGEKHGQVEVELIPEDGSLFLEARIHDVRVDLRLYTDIAGDFDGYVSSSRVTVAMRLEFRSGASGLRAMAREPDVQLHRFRIDVEDVSDTIENMAAVRGAVRDEIETALRDKLARDIPAWMDGLIEDVTAPATHEVRGRRLRTFADPAPLRIGPEGIALDATMGAFTPEPIEERTRAPGYYHIPRRRFDPEVRTETIRAGVALDAMNSTVFALWLAGATSYRVESLRDDGSRLTFATLLALLPGLRGLAPASAPAALAVDAALPPIVVEGPSRSLEANVADLRIRVLVEEDGEERQVAELSLGGEVALHVAAREGQLVFERQRVTLEVEALGATEPLSASGNLEELLQPLARDALDAVLEASALPLPELAGFEIEVRRERVSDGYLVLDGNLYR